jgi:hypothetical protein
MRFAISDVTEPELQTPMKAERNIIQKAKSSARLWRPGDCIFKPFANDTTVLPDYRILAD